MREHAADVLFSGAARPRFIRDHARFLCDFASCARPAVDAYIYVVWRQRDICVTSLLIMHLSQRYSVHALAKSGILGE